MLELQSLMQDNPLTTEKDRWQYCWDAYSAKAFYDQIHAHIRVPMVYAWLWKSACIMKTKVFAWLLLSDTHAYEDRVHLFFECKFSARV
jgi:hypothetical protein